MVKEETIYKGTAMVLALAIIFGMPSGVWKQLHQEHLTSLEEVLQSSDVDLPVVWGDTGSQLRNLGVIDMQKWEKTMGLKSDQDFLSASGRVHLTRQNAGVFLNYLWALGLANKSRVLDEGEMRAQNLDVSRFASTGGWTAASTTAMDHYSKHEIIKLTPQQEALLDEISKNIYRPCCNNSTHFPDCNHGMAMLGLLQLMISQSLPQEKIYQTALTADAYWFPSAYHTISLARDKNFVSYTTNPKELLGFSYSSGRAMANMSKVIPPSKQPQGSCSLN